MRASISALFLALASCSAPFGPLGTRRLVLVLPERPPSWSCLPGLAFELEWIGASGLAESAALEPGARLEVELARGRPQAILARPRYRGRALAPAGALYPSDAAGEGGPFRLPRAGPESLVLDWRGGYAAEVARRLEARGIEAGRFDLARLRREAEVRVADPWGALAPAEAARRLAEGSFRADALRERPAFPVALPGPGPWAPESPLAAPPRSLEGGLFRVDLPEGGWRFVGPGAELLVAVDGRGGYAAVRLALPSPPPGEARCGRPSPRLPSSRPRRSRHGPGRCA